MEYEKLIVDEITNVNFLEIKEGTDVKVGDKIYSGPINLPIRTDNLMEIIKEDQDNINFEYFIDGCIYLVSLSDNKDMVDLYLDILNNYTDSLKAYILHKSLNFLDKNLFTDSLVYLNALVKLGHEDEKILFSLGVNLENMDISSLTDKEKNQYIIEIMNTYEKILNYDESFDLSYYKLGYIYRDMMQYKKSQLFFEKFLNLSKDELKLQEVRVVLDQMTGNILLEEAIEALNKEDINTALDKLKSVPADQLTDIHYYHFSIIYLQLNLWEESEKTINMALELKEEKTYHSQRALVYYGQNRTDEAIKELENTIDKYGPDYNLNYNLASIYYKLDNMDAALGNYQIAYKLNPSPELGEIIEYLQRQIEL